MFIGMHINWVVVGLAVLLGLMLLTPMAFKRFALLGKSQVNKAVKAMENLDPVAVYEERINESAHKLGLVKDNLAKVQAVIAGLKRQLDTTEQEQAILVTRIQRHLAEGAAGEQSARAYAEQLTGVESSITSIKTSIQRHNDSYEALRKQAVELQSTITATRSKAATLGTELELSKQEVAMGKLTNELAGSGASTDDLKHLENAIHQKIDENHARSSVATEVDPTLTVKRADDAADRKASVDAVLNRFKPQPNNSTKDV